MGVVDLDGLSNAVSKNDKYYQSVELNVKKTLYLINELSTLYVGKDIEFLFKDIVDQNKNINKISTIVKDYSSTLSSVKQSYIAQDEYIKSMSEKTIQESDI